MNLIFLGPQASGKGTQAKLLVEKFGFQYMETGKILRQIISAGGDMAQRLDQILNQKGTLVPDSTMIKIITDQMAKLDLPKGVIFDGYPRSLDQYQTLKTIFKEFKIELDKVVFVSVSKPESLRRLSARRICSKCQKEYNLITKPPISPGKCDDCGQALIARADDNPETIEKRLSIFENQTRPILDQAKTEGLLLQIDGDRPVDEIHQDIVARLGLAPN